MDQALPDRLHNLTDSEAGDPNGFVAGRGSLETDEVNFRNAGFNDHLFDRHTGRTDQDLIDRATGANAPLGGASAYSSREAAEYYTSEILVRRARDIGAYLNTGDRRPRAFDLDFNQGTGLWVANGSTNVQTVTAARVVILPDPNAPNGYRIITGHPIETPKN